MPFEPKLKELARARDAVDRLRGTQQKSMDRKAAAIARFDFIVRAIALNAIVWLVYYAFQRM